MALNKFIKKSMASKTIGVPPTRGGKANPKKSPILATPARKKKGK